MLSPMAGGPRCSPAARSCRVCLATDQTVTRESIRAPAGAPQTPTVEGEAQHLAPILWIGVLAALGAAALAALARTNGWIFHRRVPVILQLSGNIEAHESVLSFKGVQSRIVALPFDEGASVKQGTVIARVDDTLADIDHVWLRTYVNETDIGRIRLGEPAILATDNYPGKHYRGRVSFIAEQAEFTPKSVETHAERVTLVYRIRIDLDNPTHELVPGMPADAELRLLP